MATPALPVTPGLARRLGGRPLLLVLDIDGTMSPIASRPESAVVPAATQRVLRELSHTDGVHVAVITGRAVEDARRLVGVPGIWIIGNHGMEVAPPDRPAVVHADVARYAGQIAAASARASEIARNKPGIVVEDKRWTLSVHHRLSHPRIVPGLTGEIATVARELGLKLTHGKEVIELRPPVSIDKGTAAVEIAHALGALDDGASLLSAGDDRTDEDMFRALRDRHPASVTVRVGSRTGAPVETAAEFCVEDPDGIRELLDFVLAQRSDGRQN
jgi:trehalose-phosphatase